jgi:hypothetical protein
MSQSGRHAPRSVVHELSAPNGGQRVGGWPMVTGFGPRGADLPVMGRAAQSCIGMVGNAEAVSERTV